ncbi:MAG: hypothetical protein IPN60_03595 [Saprospiraceae bacterium]|nr:hypothetical protein [Candidatus Opimibacter skivensis]MBP6679644.1 hypothetical protein [Saprospiraceae bacterium]MBP8086047.1 hypothetical protein [Saprospiraceae bacterium]HQW27207.1 hypothetical protein [Saprospiraceae bacterium]
MAKTGKQKKARNFEEEYNEVLNGFVPSPYTQGNHQQWTAPGDFFVKFSMYKETSSGTTSTSTSFINP